jgi:hypothetical protein
VKDLGWNAVLRFCAVWSVAILSSFAIGCAAIVAFPTIAGLVVHIGVTLNVGMAVAVGVSFAWNRRCSYLWVLSIVGSVATAIGCDALWATSWGHA